jgi:putative transposase
VSCRMVGDWRTQGSQLFRDDRDYERFLLQLADRVEQFDVRLYMFVCMANHFHLVFETPQANCSRFMQSLSTAYTVYFNLRHHRHGHLLDGRYKAKIVEGDEYLRKLSRYVHLNPVQIASMKSLKLSERRKALRAYRWSSYRSYTLKKNPLECVQTGPALAQVGGSKAERPARYRRFVESGLAETDTEFETIMKSSPLCIGTDGFREWAEELYRETLLERNAPEDVSFKHGRARIEVDRVMAVLVEHLDVDAGAP